MRTTRSIRIGENDITLLASSLFEKVRDIKATHPLAARKIDALEREIRDRLQEIRRQISKFPKTDQELVKVLVINGLYRTADEVIIDGSAVRPRPTP